MPRISKYQLFCLIMLFEIGSTTLFALGIRAKQDAWLVVIIAMLGGFYWLWVYTCLQRYFPEKNLVEIIKSILGKFLGIPLSFIYGINFLNDAVSNLTEFGYLINMTFLRGSSLIVIYTIFMIVILYGLFKGFEVVAHLAEILFPVLLLFLLLIFFLVTISGEVNIKEITPILGNGITSGHIYEFLHISTFPFGEMFIFLMYWCYLEEKELIRRISFFAVGISGILLTISLIIIISVLGDDYASVATIPLLEVIKLIDIGNIITNLDALGIAIIFIGGFFKTLLRFYAGVLVFTTLFKLKENRWLLILLGIVTVIYGNSFIVSFPFHRWYGDEIITKIVYPIIEFVVPNLLLVICWLKQMIHKKNT